MNIIVNKKLGFNYIIHKRYEAGIVLHGWEVKSIRNNYVNIIDSHAYIKNVECWIVGLQIQPLLSVSLYDSVVKDRHRKILLHKKELKNLYGLIKIKRYTLIPSKLYWLRNLIKLELCLCTGKKEYDKRQAAKLNDWNRMKSQLFKHKHIT